MLKTSLKQTISLIFFGLFLCGLLLELGLRIGGFIFLSFQEHRNMVSISKNGSYRIMCLGESTTAGQYPRFLEEILTQRNIGIRFSVIDKGIPGTGSSYILSQLEYNLDEYHPHMVVAMMGVNDHTPYMAYKAESNSTITHFFSHLRACNFAKLIWLRILNKVKETGDPPKKTITPQPLKVNGNYFFDLAKNYHSQGKLSQAEEAYKRNIVESGSQHVWSYLELGWLYYDQGELFQAEEVFKRALELHPRSYEAYTALGWFYQKQGKFSQEEAVFKKALRSNPQDDRLYGALSLLYEEMGNSELAKEYEKRTSAVRLRYYKPDTVNSYRRLKAILDKRGIRLVCAQYPVRSIEPLKKIFEEEGIIFVDDEKIFREAIKKGSYGEYFVDKFGGDFGHCNDRGNRLLAENIANVILREVFHK